MSSDARSAAHAVHRVTLATGGADDSDDLLRAGLAAEPKRVPNRFNYDLAGSALYEEIVRLPDYYPPLAERRLLDACGDDIVSVAGITTVIDLGAGNAEKTEHLLQCVDRHAGLAAYTAIDVSAEPTVSAAQRIQQRWPDATVTAIHGDFLPALRWLRGRGRHRLLALLGSTYGNLSIPERRRLLDALRQAGDTDDRFLLCLDLNEPADAVERAYSAGYDGKRPVRRMFALNCLTHLNRRYRADFDLDAFRPEITYDQEGRDVRAVLRSTRPQTVRLARLGLEVAFAEGEPMLHDVLHKFTVPELVAEVEQACFQHETHWVEAEHQYAAFLFSFR
ncbi:L-histidine N(alpha)-methyltransferase [Streptomyces sp. NPDC017993]|uniref:L-histidine N(alpha)-methyltransferase n=1 Tax=Streptomyces sp. NPDC017993 TaxID=3365027 RepID=UPI0037A8B42D